MSDAAPPGYVDPFLIYAVELTNESGDDYFGQTGTFTTEAEADKLVARFSSEGRRVRINVIPVHQRLRTTSSTAELGAGGSRPYSWWCA